MVRKIGLAVSTVAVSLLIASGVAFAQTSSPSPTTSASPSPSASVRVPSGAPSTGMAE